MRARRDLRRRVLRARPARPRRSSSWTARRTGWARWSASTRPRSAGRPAAGSGCSTRSSRTRGWTPRAVTPVAAPAASSGSRSPRAQWELLVHADGQRTPADLAQLLGRAGYATIQELRRLAALGPDRAARRSASGERTRFRTAAPRPRGTAVDVAPTARCHWHDRPTVPDHRRARDRPRPRAIRPPPAPGGATRPTATARVVPAAAAGPPQTGRQAARRSWPPSHPPTHPGTDEVLLKRIRTALRALR